VTWFERLSGGQVVTETLMGINQQPQLSSHRLHTCGPIDNQRLRRSVEVCGCGLNAGIPFNGKSNEGGGKSGFCKSS
jgi:hypothetical protein